MGSIIKYVSKRFPRLKEGNKIYKSRDEIMISLQHFTNLPREIREINKRGWEPNKLRGSAKIRKRKNAPPPPFILNLRVKVNFLTKFLILDPLEKMGNVMLS